MYVPAKTMQMNHAISGVMIRIHFITEYTEKTCTFIHKCICIMCIVYINVSAYMHMQMYMQMYKCPFRHHLVPMVMNK